MGGLREAGGRERGDPRAQSRRSPTGVRTGAGAGGRGEGGKGERMLHDGSARLVGPAAPGAEALL